MKRARRSESLVDEKATETLRIAVRDKKYMHVIYHREFTEKALAYICHISLIFHSLDGHDKL